MAGISQGGTYAKLMRAEQPAYAIPRTPQSKYQARHFGKWCCRGGFFIRENQLLVIMSPSSWHSLLSLPSADTFACAEVLAMELTWGLNTSPICFLQQSTVSWILMVEGMARHERKERNH